jgi:hypothetical protein
MDKSTKKLFRKLENTYITRAGIESRGEERYLILDIVDKKRHLRAFSLLLRTPALMTELNMSLNVVEDIQGFMNQKSCLKMRGAFEKDEIILIYTDGNCLEVNLKERMCFVVDHDEGRNRQMTHRLDDQGFD